MNAETMENEIGDATDQMLEKGRALTNRFKATAQSTDEYVHGNPWTAVGVAVAVGLLIGFLVGQRNR